GREHREGDGGRSAPGRETGRRLAREGRRGAAALSPKLSARRTAGHYQVARLARGGPSPRPCCGSPSARDVLRLGLPDCSPRTAGPQPRDVLRLGLPDCSPRTAGPQPRDVLRLGLPDCSPRTAGPQPRDVLRLARQEPCSGGRVTEPVARARPPATGAARLARAAL